MIQSVEQGRMNDGNRSIADKIIKRLSEIDKSVNTNQGRWAWELLQNAKDSVANDPLAKVSISIKFDSNSIQFSHDGACFTQDDIRGIINQISSKEADDGEITLKTGRFGTGFLTTHLLSKKVRIRGVFDEGLSNYYSFDFLLDREASTTKQLIGKLDSTWDNFYESAKKMTCAPDMAGYNTSFEYVLETRQQHKIAEIGIDEFIKLLPYVLAFTPRFKEIQIINSVSNEIYKFSSLDNIIDYDISRINVTHNEINNTKYIKLLCNKVAAVAVEFNKVDDNYYIIDNKKLPKLFCDFPLIGSEDFNYPVIINSSLFSPHTERTGIWLSGDSFDANENKSIIEAATELYKDLIKEISSGPFYSFYNVVETDLPSLNENQLDHDWFKLKIQKPLKEFIVEADIVDIQSSFNTKKSINSLYFPLKSFNDSQRSRVWDFYYHLKRDEVCRLDDLNQWIEKSWKGWNKIDYQDLLSEVSRIGDVKGLQNILGKSSSETLSWLNSLGDFILQDKSNLYLLDRHRFIPNRYGVFKYRFELNIDEIHDDDLLNILKILGTDWYKISIHPAINFGEYTKITKSDIAQVITVELKKIQNDLSEILIKAVTFLAEWFEKASVEETELFPELYKRRAELFMNTIGNKESLYKVMRSKINLDVLATVVNTIEDRPNIVEDLRKAHEISLLLEEYHFDTIMELKDALNNNIKNISKFMMTQESLASLGITSIEEFEAALDDSDLSSIFNHISSSDPSMFEYAHKIISRAKKNIISHLRNDADYDCNDLEELAPTVLGGIRKFGQPICIVVRPSDNGEVILFYNSEKDTLDYSNSEFWVDNGITSPHQLTLGTLLKKIGISRIPLY